MEICVSNGFIFKQETAYEMRIRDWSADVCSSDLFTEGLSQGSATLFMGACIALTAFPMLARIINERGLADTALGTLTLTAGAFDDAASWCVQLGRAACRERVCQYV